MNYEQDYDLDDSITALIIRTVRTELRSFARDVAKATVHQVEEDGIPYDYGYLTMTIRFAEGSDPKAISVPYQMGAARTELNLDGYRLVKVP